MTMTMQDVFAARKRIAPWVRRTPLVPSDWLSSETGAQVRIKLESLQVTNAFKARGAFNIALSMPEPRPRLITASSGNHGRALSHAARMLGFQCVVFAPSTTPAAKLEPVRRSGATLNVESPGYDEAEAAAMQFARDQAAGGAMFVSAYNDERIIAATGTIAMEICEDDPAVDVILVPIGGGGLISGVAMAAKAMRPGVRVIGVEAAHNAFMHTARARGAMALIDVQPTLADGIAGNNDLDSITFDYIQRFVDDIVLVSEEEIADALRGFAARERLIVEGAGAVATAALLAKRIDNIDGRHVAVIASGSNIDLTRLAPILASQSQSQRSHAV